jgi:hypothetical protein
VLPASDPAVTHASSWAVQETPNPTVPNGFLVSDSCTSSTKCTAVGRYESSAGNTLTLAEAWNGTTWRIETTPNPAGATTSLLSAVSCTSARACTAVGYYYDSAGDILTLAEAWNGTSWSTETTPNPAGVAGSGLLPLSCTSARACTAAGTYNNRSGVPVTLAERWSGTS